MTGFLVVLFIFILFFVISIVIIEKLLVLRRELEESERIYRNTSFRRINLIHQYDLARSDSERRLVEECITSDTMLKLHSSNKALSASLEIEKSEKLTQYERELDSAYNMYIEAAKRYNESINRAVVRRYAGLLNINKVEVDE